jgi:undecaprenyl diphosphate synthase
MPSSELSLPSHIGIIMDGNGRWAKKKNLPRTAGHNEGLQAAKRIVKAASDFGIRFLTLYVFSTENWRRAEDEVSFLMKLIKLHLKKEYDFYRENHVRVLHSGELSRLPDDVKKEIGSVTKDTAQYDGLTVNLAINYGGRDEIIRAVNRHLRSLSKENGNLQPPGGLAVTENDVAENLDLPDLPEADLIIRTGGEMRLSNFLLWESAYAEFYFSKKLWPDWDKTDLAAAIEEYSRRERRFGGVK